MAPPVAVEEQVLILQTMLLLVEAAEKKQYDAPWREGGKKVWRDASGRFTRDGGGGGADASQIPAISKQYAVAQDLANQTQQSLENAIEQSPEFAANLADNLFGEGAQKLRNNVARFYRKNAPDLAKAIKNENPWEEISGAVQGLVKGGDRKQSAKDLAGGIVHAFKWVGAKYKEGLDKLNNLEGPPAVRMLGKVAAAAIPVGVFLAATLTPELAIGLMVGEGLTSILAGAAVGQAVSFGVNKALDAAHVENPWLRIGVDIVAGVAAAGGVAAGTKRLRKVGAARRQGLQEMASDSVADGVASTRPKPPKEVAPPKSKAPNLRRFPDSLDDLETVRPLGGSTGAQLVKDKETGKLFVMKGGASEAHIAEEAVANDAYRALGVKVPKHKLIRDEFGVTQLTEFIEGRSLYEVMDDPAEFAHVKEQLQQHFAADALLGNWDVAGSAFDNVLVGTDGVVYRVDNGGSLRFRAQGALKGKAFGPDVTELDSLRDPAVNMNSARIFGDLSDEAILTQIDNLKLRQGELMEVLPDDLKPLLKRRLQGMKQQVKDAISAKKTAVRQSVRSRFEDTLQLKPLRRIDNSPMAYEGISGEQPYSAEFVEKRIQAIFDDLPEGIHQVGPADLDDAIDEVLRQQWSRPDVRLEDLIHDSNMGLMAGDRSPYSFIEKTPGIKQSRYYGKEPPNPAADVDQAFWEECTPDERAALKGYTHTDSEMINGILRGWLGSDLPEEGIVAWEQKINLTKSALGKLPQYQANAPVVRFLNGQVEQTQALVKRLVAGEIKEGHIFSDPGFSSTTASSTGAGNFTNAEPNFKVKMVIHPAQQSAGKYVESITAVPGEYEVLYPPGMQFRVKQVYEHEFIDRLQGKNHSRWIVEVEEVE